MIGWACPSGWSSNLTFNLVSVFFGRVFRASNIFKYELPSQEVNVISLPDEVCCISILAEGWKRPHHHVYQKKKEAF